MYLAASLKEYTTTLNPKGSFKKLIKPGLVVMYSLGCMVLQKDLGSALIFFGISVTMLYIATTKARYVLVCLGLSAVGAVAAYNLFGHVRERVLIWRHPWEYTQNQSYQLVQGLYAISSGGMMGSGLGQGYPGFVPINTSDFIFAIIGEELGLIGCAVVIMLFVILVYRCVRIALNCTDIFTCMVVIGIGAQIGIQAALNIAVATSSMPVTGVALPFISYGGTSLIIFMSAVGIVLNISKHVKMN